MLTPSFNSVFIARQAISDGPMLQLSGLVGARTANAGGGGSARGGGWGGPWLPGSNHHHQPAELVCFEEAIVGIDKRTTWYVFFFRSGDHILLSRSHNSVLRRYQYGFAIPQGPIPWLAGGAEESRAFRSKDVSAAARGRLVRLAAHQLVAGLGLARPRLPDAPADEQRSDQSVQPPPQQQQRAVVLFSRTRNRLILNEGALCQALEAKFGVYCVSFFFFFCLS